MASTVAIATRRRSPIESWYGARGRAAHAHRGERLAPRARDLRAGRAQVERAEGTSSAHGGHEELVVGVLEDQPTRARSSGSAVLDLQAGHLERALAAHQPVQVEHQRRLAGAVGPRIATRSPWLTCRSTPLSAAWPLG